MKSTPLNIWIVEDDPTYHEMLLSYLKVLGHAAQGFFSGEALLSQISHKPDVVILDHNLGSGMKGVDVLRQIKYEKSNIPVIYISGEEQVSLVSDVYRSGSEDYIGKDSASLLRLKLCLEKIQQLNSNKLEKKRIQKIRFARLVLAAILSAAVIIALSIFDVWSKAFF
jgi:DNA-binding response OmpR family regulator